MSPLYETIQSWRKQGKEKSNSKIDDKYITVEYSDMLNEFAVYCRSLPFHSSSS